VKKIKIGENSKQVLKKSQTTILAYGGNMTPMAPVTPGAEKMKINDMFMDKVINSSS
jgi:hypothetical protein